jgi:hypothetical protein
MSLNVDRASIGRQAAPSCRTRRLLVVRIIDCEYCPLRCLSSVCVILVLRVWLTTVPGLAAAARGQLSPAAAPASSREDHRRA